MMRDEMIITIKQMDETLHELFRMIGLNADPSIYEVARDIASCKACGVPYQLPSYEEIIQDPSVQEDVDESANKEDNVLEDKEAQEKENDG